MRRSFSPGGTLASTALRLLTLVASTMQSELTQTSVNMNPLTARPRRNVSRREICRFSQMMLSGCEAKAALSKGQ